MGGYFIKEAVRPSVLVYAVPPVSEMNLSPLLWGLEEEGIPGEVREFPDAPAETLARQAAEDSALDVGIGLNEMAGVAVLHHRDLLAHAPLFTLKAQDFMVDSLRRLGVNAARLVKRMPLVFNEGPKNSPGNQKSLTLSPKEFEELVSRIVTQVFWHYEETKPRSD